MDRMQSFDSILKQLQSESAPSMKPPQPTQTPYRPLTPHVFDSYIQSAQLNMNAWRKRQQALVRGDIETATSPYVSGEGNYKAR